MNRGSHQHNKNFVCYSTFADSNFQSALKTKMTSIVPRLNCSHRRKDGRFPVVIQVIRHRVKREIDTPFRLWKAEFNNKMSRIDGEKSKFTLEEVESMNNYLTVMCYELTLVSEALFRDRGETYTAEDVIDTYKCRTDMKQLFTYADSLVDKLENTGHKGTAAGYRNACRSLEDFLGRRVLAFSDFTVQCVDDFVDFLYKRGNRENTVVCYLKQLRAIYNKAFKANIVKVDLKPFRNQSFHTSPTRKRALCKKDMKRLEKVDLSKEHRDVRLVHDLFMASFLGRGISFVDLCYLRKECIEGGYLCYKRHKTRQTLRVFIEKPLKEIFARYADPDSPYLFPMLRGCTDEHRGYLSAKDRLYKRIRRLGTVLGLEFSLTFHVARHTWATLAHNAGAEISVISSCLGHTSEKTTRIYLAEMDIKKLDSLNRMVLKQLE